jgi:hypothetical protein
MPLESGSTNQETIHIKKMKNKKKLPNPITLKWEKTPKKTTEKTRIKKKEKRLTTGSV